MRLRSPILARLPNTNIHLMDSAKRVSLRLIIGGPIVALLLCLIVIIHFELAPKDSVLGAVLYGLHDNIFLPFKGNLYTRQFPESLIWWGTIGTILSLIVGSLLLDRSLIKEPHIILIRWGLLRPNLHRFIINGSRILRRFGLRPFLIQRVAQREWEAAVLTLGESALSEGPVALCERVSALTRFQLHMTRFFRESNVSHLQMLELWHYGYMMIHVYGNYQTNRGLRALTNLLNVFPTMDDTRFGTIAEIEIGQLFEPAVLYQDVANLAQLGQQRFGIDAGSVGHVDRQLAMRIEQRRHAVLNESELRLERGLSLLGTNLAETLMYQPILLSNSAETLPICGRIALNVALHTAYWTAVPQIGLAYAEAVESLDFMLAATTLKSPAIEKLSSLMQEALNPDENTHRYIPLWEAYRQLAHQLATIQQKQKWQADQLSPDISPIHVEDVELAWGEIAELMQVVGQTHWE